jgi:hypothetical protein
MSSWLGYILPEARQSSALLWVRVVGEAKGVATVGAGCMGKIRWVGGDDARSVALSEAFTLALEMILTISSSLGLPVLVLVLVLVLVSSVVAWERPLGAWAYLQPLIWAEMSLGVRTRRGVSCSRNAEGLRMVGLLPRRVSVPSRLVMPQA